LYSVAICDDDQQLCFYIENVLLEYGDMTGKAIKTEVFFSGEELCEYLAAGTYYDLIFLDIEMKILSGIDVGVKIRDEMKNETIQIVFISSYIEYAFQLFKTRPMNFLIKPLKESDIINATEKSIQISNKQTNTFLYNVKQETHKELLDDILYFSVSDREVKIHLLNNIKRFYGTLDSVWNELSQYSFIRIHRSYLVNYNKINAFLKDRIILVNGEVLPISRTNQKEVRVLRNLLKKN